MKELENVQGGIEFRDLTFRYPDGEFDELEHVSFKINPGENIGLVGKTGAGKTTLVDLILRTYNVPDGTLFIDGQDVNTVSIHSVRENCAYVPQDNFLFSDTIARNIAFGSREVDQKAVRRAALLADVDENIAQFQEGYDTVLGERGVTVSGGQKQRISIARALMKDAPVLILDDSVSAVDTKTERAILDNLRQTRQGKTTILIAHRISIQKVNIHNVWELLALEVDENQKGFVATNIESIVEAYTTLAADGVALPFGIYKDKTPVGFLMIGYGDQPEVDNPAAEIILVVQKVHLHPVGPAGELEYGAVLLPPAKAHPELGHLFGDVSGVATTAELATEHIELVIHAEPEEGYVVQRLHREKRCGTVTELGGGNWRFEADVFDAVELLPWIRTFTGRIVSLKSTNAEVEKRFYGDLAALRAMYGGDADAVQ